MYNEIQHSVFIISVQWELRVFLEISFSLNEVVRFCREVQDPYEHCENFERLLNGKVNKNVNK
jgi:hypothetical protein